MIEMTTYACRVVHPIRDRIVGGGPCRMTASYFAIDDRAIYGHVCRQCWAQMGLDDRALYAPQAAP